MSYAATTIYLKEEQVAIYIILYNYSHVTLNCMCALCSKLSDPHIDHMHARDFPHSLYFLEI